MGYLILTFLLVLGLCIVISLLIRALDEKRRALALLAEQAQALEREVILQNTIFDSMPDIMFCKDLDFRLTRINKAFENHFGIDRQVAIGKREHELLNLPADVADGFKEWDSTVISTKKAHRIEELVPDKDGTLHMFETMKVPILSDNIPQGIFGVARDISKRKEMESEIVKASVAKTAFIANMSHEIRTPMNGIVGFSELVMEEGIPNTARTYLRHIIKNSNDLLQIINDMLDISKIESGELDLESVPFDLNEIFLTCKSTVLPKALERGLKLNFILDDNLKSCSFVGDPDRMRQILVNLLSNAIKFTDVGTVTLESKVVAVQGNKKIVEYKVRDSGIGMNQEQIARVLEPFMQADVSVTRRYGGIGLGLFLVKSLVDSMDGIFEIESILGVGSIFTIRLAFDTYNDALEEKPTDTQLKNDKKPWFDAEVLVCEDNAMNQIVVTEHLQRLGLKVKVVENGFLGFLSVQERINNNEKQFDLIFMDIHMPVMGGVEAAVKIQEICSTIPIIALTANVMSTDREAYKQSGMKDCIGKPFSGQDLSACLLKYITPISWKDISTNAAEATRQAGDLQKILEYRFVKENKDKFQQIMYLINNNRIADAHIMVHTLKSTAGLIGRHSLQNIAQTIETDLKDGTNNVTTQNWNLLELELNSILEALAPLYTSLEEEHSGNIKTENAYELIQKLEMLLQARNADSINLLSDIRQVQGLEEVVEYVERYEFKQALLKLEEIKKGLGVEL